MKFLLLLTILVSCTEEISQKVQNSSSADNNTLSEVEKFNDKSIRLVHKMDEELSFIMHKAGSLTDPCEIKSPTLGFKAEDYTKSDTNYAIDCILDAEELDLHLRGAKVELQVDDFLCENVEYTPYTFLNFNIGASFNNYYTIQCDTVCEESGISAIKDLCGKTYQTYKGRDDILFSGGFKFIPKTNVGTLTYQAGDFPEDDRLLSPEKACRFNYDEEGIKCDLGRTQEVIIKFESSQDLDGDGEIDQVAGEDIDPVCNLNSINHYSMTHEVKEVKRCGGTIEACVEEAQTEEGYIDNYWQTVQNSIYEDRDLVTSVSSIFRNADLESLAIPFTYKSPSELGFIGANYPIANYSRICANTSNQKNDFENLTASALAGEEIEMLNTSIAFAGGEESVFDIPTPGLTDNNGYGLRQPIYDSENLMVAIGYAHHPLQGKFGARPYYSFKCLDQARDTKAQIRLFIREWDRDFTESNSYLNRSSDYDTTGTRTMDTYRDAQDLTEFWNDYDDWDDFFMENALFVNNNNQCTLADSSDDNIDGLFDTTDEHANEATVKTFPQWVE